MVKANFSFGGKLLLVLVTVIIYTFVLIGGIIGGALYAYNNVKVGELLDLLQQSQWISEEYSQKTIRQFIEELQEELAGDGLTLQTIINFSPQAGEMLDGLVDNLNENGIVTIDRETLYNTRVDQLSSSLKDIAVVTATLGSLQESLGVDLPDMPVISGGGEEPVYIYAAANGENGGSIEKAFTFGDYTYYTKSASRDVPATQDVTYTLYAPTDGENDALSAEGNYLKAGDYFLYLRSQEEGQEPVYRRIHISDPAVYAETVNDATHYRLTVGTGVYKKCLPGEGDAAYAALGLTAGETVQTHEVLAQYRYQPLYAADGTEATDGPDENGRYTVRSGFRDQPLFAARDVYTEVAEENLENGIPSDAFLEENTVYVRSDGLSGLPLLKAVSALSSVLDTKTLTLRTAGTYFGISLENDMTQGLLDIPLAYLGSNMDEGIREMELGAVLGLDADNYEGNELLFYLAYGTKDVDFRIENGEVAMIGNKKPNTVADISAGMFDSITVGDIVGESSHPLMQAISGWTISDLTEGTKIDSLTIGDIVDLSSTASPVLLALKDISLGELPNAVDSLTIGDIAGNITESDNLLWALRDCTLGNLALSVQNLALQDLFAESMYEYFEIGTVAKYDTRYREVFVLQNYDYALYSPAAFPGLPGDTPVYARYIVAYENGQTVSGYENIPLYAYADGQFVLATEVTAWKMPAGYDEGTAYFKLVKGSYTEVKKDELTGIFDVSALYYLDENGETAELPLLPAQLAVSDEYADDILYSKYLLAEKTMAGDGATGYYRQANLYCFDYESMSFRRIPVGAQEDKNAPYLVAVTKDGTPAGEGETAAGYIVQNFAGAVYTHGDVRGIWKYMLTNAEGAEEIAALTDIGALMSNITYNLNHKTLGDMRDDGILSVSAEDGSDPLETPVPEYIAPGGQAGLKLKDLSINDLLNITAKALQYLENPETIPGFGGTAG